MSDVDERDLQRLEDDGGTPAPEPAPPAPEAGPVPPARPRVEVKNGLVVTDGAGTNYVVSNYQKRALFKPDPENPRRRIVSGLYRESMTLCREIPKVRGKAARKAEKRARRRERIRRALDARANVYVEVDWPVRVAQASGMVSE